MQDLEAVKQLVKTPLNNTLQYVRGNGEKIIYCQKSNVFIALTENGIPKTMMKPRDGLKYFEKQILKDKK